MLRDEVHLHYLKCTQTVLREAAWPSGQRVGLSDHYLDLFHGSPEFKSLARLVNS